MSGTVSMIPLPPCTRSKNDFSLLGSSYAQRSHKPENRPFQSMQKFFRHRTVYTRQTAAPLEHLFSENARYPNLMPAFLQRSRFFMVILFSNGLFWKVGSVHSPSTTSFPHSCLCVSGEYFPYDQKAGALEIDAFQNDFLMGYQFWLP